MTGQSEFLSAALEAAQVAAEVIRHHWVHGVDVTLKGDDTPVTRADVEAERAIRGCLEARFPAHGFYGEETGRTREGSDYLWLVDPIDGTKSFVRGYPFFSTQIALMHRGDLLVGVSSAPVFGELMCAQRGGGAWLDGRRVQVSDVDRIEDASVSAGNLRSLATDAARWQDWGGVVARVNRIRGYGDFYHYHLLARGSIDAVVESDVSILDIAALALIVREAGGRFTALDGADVDVGTTSVLAGNAALHARLLAALGTNRHPH
jgi:histidinol-phosphatase